MPAELRQRIYQWVEQQLHQEWKEGWNREQFIYSSRKKAFGPFKQELWQLSEQEKQPVREHLEQQFRIIFERLNVVNTQEALTPYVKSHDNASASSTSRNAEKQGGVKWRGREERHMVQHIFSQDKPVGDIDLVMAFDGPMPTGVSVSHSGRIFVNFPRWDDPTDFTVAELREENLHPYPNAEMQHTDTSDHSSVLLSVQSVVIDPLDRLWILDTGAPQHRTTSYGGPKLVGVDLAQNRVIKTILFPREVALSTTYLNDIRFDLRRGEQGMAFITDSSAQTNGIIVVDLASGQSWRRLHEHPSTKAEKGFLPVVEGQPLMRRPPDGPPQPYRSGVDGIAISNDGARLFYSALMGRRLYSVSIDALVNRALDDATVATTIVDEGDKGGGGDGMESDAENCVYTTNYEHNAILRRQPDGLYETLVHDPRLLWPDTLSLATDGYLYFTVNQLHRGPRFHRGKDLRERPFGLFRVRVDASPVLLR